MVRQGKLLLWLCALQQRRDYSPAQLSHGQTWTTEVTHYVHVYFRAVVLNQGSEHLNGYLVRKGASRRWVSFDFSFTIESGPNASNILIVCLTLFPAICSTAVTTIELGLYHQKPQTYVQIEAPKAK